MSDEHDPAVAAAWAYEGLHVDSLFRQWAKPVLDAASVSVGNDVLDVACGTGVVARHALARVGPSGSVTGLDLGPGMLAVAEAIAPRVRWVEGDAGRLPFDDHEFDAVVSQFGLMFFPDRPAAIREMVRCTKPGGPIVVAVWGALERNGAYPLVVDLLDRRAGPDAADALRAPFALGDPDHLRSLFDDAGVPITSIDTQVGTARFPDVRTLVEAELRGWLPIMGVVLDDELIEQILAEAEDVLDHLVTANGEVVFDAPTHIVTAQT
ncbi:MAG: methyltransferase domain-containing protein [Ilumatobacteraceae bacterium]